MKKHPLHMAIADTIAKMVGEHIEIIRDPACAGDHQVPLFVGQRKGNDTRMCCVDLLGVLEGKVRIIVEIEESGFIPTKICGKFLQAALSDHFIHDIQSGVPMPYGKRVLFIQILDGSACLKDGGKKRQQAEIIEGEIQRLLPLRGLTDYRLFFVNGPNDSLKLKEVGSAVSAALGL